MQNFGRYNKHGALWSMWKWWMSWWLSSNTSSVRCSVSSPDETLRRELKIWCASEYFWWTSRCFIWWWNTASNAVSNAWHYFSNKVIVEREIKVAKMSSFSSHFQTLIKHYFPLCFLYELLMSLRSSFWACSQGMLWLNLALHLHLHLIRNQSAPFGSGGWLLFRLKIANLMRKREKFNAISLSFKISNGSHLQ